MSDTNVARNRTNPARKLTVLAVGAGLALAGAGAADAADVPVLDRSLQLERSLAADETRQDYRGAVESAERFDVEPKRDITVATAPEPELIAGYAELKGKVATAKAKELKEAEQEPEFETPESVGVSQSTLDAIASCESGGDPAVVDASGTYHGKYQFDVGTWASVGGSGLPSAAPEEEQDYRAALLYSQAGSSPWPVCGQ